MNTTVASPRKDKTTNRKRDILNAALALFDAEGASGVTIEGLVRAAGASVGSIYHHFGNRDGVMAALYEAGLDDYRLGLLRAVEEQPSARGKVEALVRFHLMWAEKNPAWARYLLQARRAPEVQGADGSIRQTTDAFGRRVFALFQPHIKADEIRRSHKDLYLPMVVGAAHEFTRRFLTGRTEAGPKDVADELAAATWRAVAVEPTPKERSARRKK